MRRAFTIMEVLVVVAIIVILTVIALPAFRSMIQSSEEALAESMLRSAVRAGRDAALRSSSDADAAVVFFYEPGPGSGRTVMVPYIKVAVLADRVLQETASPGASPTVQREIFVPDPQGFPVQLPRGWMVRAYAPIGAVEQNADGSGWYNQFGDADQRYDTNTFADNWVFPETAFFDSTRDNDGWHRNTFMLRFRGGTGEFVSAPATPVLIFAPNLDSRGAPNVLDPARPGRDTLRELRLSDPARYVRAVLGGVYGPNTPNPADKVMLLGRESSDMVMARPVSQIGLYQERDVAASIGVAIDERTGSFYKPPRLLDDQSTAADSGESPELVAQDVSTPGAQRMKFWQRVNLWMEGDTSGDKQYYLSDVSDPQKRDVVSAKLFALDRYSGALRPVRGGRLSP